MSEAAVPAPVKDHSGESALGRLVGVFLSPVRTFASIAARPTWILPVAIGAGLSLPLSELILSKTDWRATVTEQVAKGGRTLTEAQIDQAVEQARRLSWVWDILAVAAPVVVTFLLAAVFWAACHAFGWEVRFKQSLGVTAHAFLPGVLYSLGLAAVLWNRPTVNPQKISDLTPTNLGYFAADADRVTHGLLRLDRPFLFLVDGPARPGPLRGRKDVPGADGGPRREPVGAVRPRKGRSHRPDRLIPGLVPETGRPVFRIT